MEIPFLINFLPAFRPCERARALPVRHDEFDNSIASIVVHLHIVAIRQRIGLGINRIHEHDRSGLYFAKPFNIGILRVQSARLRSGWRGRVFVAAPAVGQTLGLRERRKVLLQKQVFRKRQPLLANRILRSSNRLSLLLGAPYSSSLRLVISILGRERLSLLGLVEIDAAAFVRSRLLQQLIVRHIKVLRSLTSFVKLS